jgi:AraC-like DNA-binding protein
MEGLITIGKVTNRKQTDLHSHNVWEMIYYTKGKSQLFLDGQIYEVMPHTFVCQPAGAMHAECGKPDFSNFYFLVRSFSTLPARVLMVQDTSNQAIFHQISEMYDCYYAKVNNYKNICQAQLNTICQYVLGQIASQSRLNPYVEKLAHLIIEHASDNNFTVEEAYKKLPYSADYLRVIFREEFGISPNRYLMRTRMRMAKELLDHEYHDQALSIKAIADMCGFRDPLYFSRCFKAETGVSPTQYFNRRNC